MTLGGRRVPVRRPRVRSADGTTEVAVPAYDLFSSTELLGAMAYDDSRNTIDVMPVIDLKRIFEQAPVVPARGK